MAAIAQIRLPGEGRTYYLRKITEAKTRKEARRCLKRRLSDMVYRQLVADAKLAEPTTAVASEESVEAGSGGHSGASLTSSAADLHTPVIGSSDQPQPVPAATTLPATRPRANPTPFRLPTPRDDAPEPSRWSAPPDERPRQAPAHIQGRRNRALDTEGNRNGLLG
jgi:transposase